MTDDDTLHRILDADATLFVGETAEHALGWLGHPERYLGAWLDNVNELLPRRHERTLLLAMGGSASPARLFAENRLDAPLSVIDTSNPDTVATTDFTNVNVIAASKSGATIETQVLLAHALANGLAVEDLVVVTDPGTSLEELAYSLGSLVFVADPSTGGRFSGLSPFGLIPALCSGWTTDELRSELQSCHLNEALVARAFDHANSFAHGVNDGSAFFALGANPMLSGGALWLEQLIAETTGKDYKGFVPVMKGPIQSYRPRDIMYWQLVAVLLARHLGVDPFSQPDVERAKQGVFALLEREVTWEPMTLDPNAIHTALERSTYNTLQAYAPLDSAPELSDLLIRVEGAYGTASANFGPRYLHSTGQLHKGGPRGVVAVQIVVRPTSEPVRIMGRRYSFHDLHMAQARSDFDALTTVGRQVFQIVVDDFADAAQILKV